MKLLSLDTSPQRTGWAIFINGRYIRSGCINLQAMMDYELRLHEMVNGIYDIIAMETPDVIVIEEVAIARNSFITKLSTMIFGTVYGKCLEAGIEWFVLRPGQWRKLVDPGKKPRKQEELKVWAKDMVYHLYKLKVNDDVADAILLGQAHVYETQQKKDRLYANLIFEDIEKGDI